MQIRELILKYKTYFQWGVAAVIALIVVGTALMSVPSTRTKAEVAFRKTKAALLGRPYEHEVSPSSLPTSTPEIVILTDRLDQLEKQVGVIESKSNESIVQLQALDESVKAAVADVSATNDLLNTREREWLAALRKVGVVISTPVPEKKSVTSTSNSNTSSSPTGSSSNTSSNSPTTVPSSGKININTASATQLDELNGIGASYAERIIAYRNEHGNFAKIEDIKNVAGIGDATYEKFKDQIEV